MSEIHNNVETEILDNTIKLIEPDVYEADNGKVQATFYQASNEVVFKNKDRTISWIPMDMRYKDGFGNVDSIYTVQEVPLEVKGNYARYNRSMPDVDDWFIMENDRLKHQILIQGFQPDPSPWLMGDIDFCVSGKMKFNSELKIFADGVEHVNPFETDGAIQLFDGEELVFELPQIIAFDSNINRAMKTGKYRVWFNDNAEMMFDIIIDHAWISSLDRIYPIVIDPTIASGNYSISGSGRKIIELDNGTLVTGAILNSNLYLFKSTDQGNSWNQMCFIDSVNAVLSWTLESAGTNVFIFYNDDRTFCLNTVNVTSQNNVNVYGSRTTPALASVGNSYYAGFDVFHDKARKKMHLSYVTSAANLKYCSITVTADNNLLFGSDAFIDSSTNFSYYGISVTINKNTGNPIVAALAEAPAGKYLFVYRQVSGSWNFTILINGLAESSISNVKVIYDLNGKLHMVLQYYDIYFGRSNTYYTNSIDGGTTWSALSLPFGEASTINHTSPDITCDFENVLYVFYTSNGSIFKVNSNNTGTSWGAPVNVASGTMGAVNFDSDFADALVSLLYVNSTLLGYSGILLNAGPNAPINLQRSSYDANNSAQYAWTHSDPNPLDPQSAFQLQVYEVSSGAKVVDTGKVASEIEAYVLAAGTLENGKQFQWRVKTWDDTDTEGAYSDFSTFYTSQKPTASIINISDGETYGSSLITVRWSMSDPESEGQGYYRLILTDLVDTVLSDTGKTTDARSRAKTIAYELENSKSYKIRLTVWDAKGVAADEIVVTVNVEYSPPAIPLISHEIDKKRGTIGLRIVNPSPTGTQPTVIYNDLYRRKLGEVGWVRIATNNVADIAYYFLSPNQVLPTDDTPFIDYTPASGQVYEYQVKAIGENGVISSSEVLTLSVTFKHAQLAATSNYSDFVYLVFNPKRNASQGVESVLLQYAGRRDPVAHYSEVSFWNASLSYRLKGLEDLVKLRDLIDKRETLLYRDQEGRREFVTVNSLEESDTIANVYEVSLKPTRVSYREEV